MDNRHIDTICAQGCYKPKSGEPRVVPIAQSTTYLYETSEAMGDLFDLKADGFFYTRLGNPTTDVVEKKIAAMEGGVGAMMTSAGMSATLLAVLNIAGAGDHIVASSALYGGTFNLFENTLPELGITTTFVSPKASDEELEAAFKPNTKLVFGESISNPSLAVLDIEKFAEHAHAHHVPLIVDNTFPTPIFCQPFKWGADIVVHSTSKYLDGHAVALGGIIVDSGNFDWTSGDFKGLTEPDESYHGLTYTESFGNAAYITKARTHLMRDLGATPSPFNAFLLDLGSNTLHLRMPRHADNAKRLAEVLEKDDRIAYVTCPSLPSSPDYELTQKYMPNGTCGVISFGIKGGRDNAQAFQGFLKLAGIETHVADLRTCVLHPASTTHRQMSDAQLEAAGVRPDMVRFSCGIENFEDILADVMQALDQLKF